MFDTINKLYYIVMIKSLEIQISPTNPLWKICDNICFKSKNLYNLSNYVIRQHYFENQKWIGQKELWNQLKKTECYNDFGHQSISNQVFRDIIENWISYFNSLKSFKKSPDSFKSPPKIPRYKDKLKGRFQTCYVISGTSPSISYSYSKTGIIRFLGREKFEIPVPDYIKGKKIKECIIVPKLSHYSIIVNYEDKCEHIELDEKQFASIDLGINNLLTITNNIGLQPIVMNGRPIKSINQYYNKKLASLQSKLPPGQHQSTVTRRLTRKRNNKIKTECHRITKYVINYLLENKVKTLIIGKNIGWKDNINIGSVNNQKFVIIPFNMIISQLKYKFEQYGGIIKLQEESYTSKASFLDLDQIPTYSNQQETKYSFSGKRVRRGLYQSVDKHKINADVNGSYNIMRKAVPNIFDNGIEGVVLHPRLISIDLNGLLIR